MFVCIAIGIYQLLAFVFFFYRRCMHTFMFLCVCVCMYVLYVCTVYTCCMHLNVRARRKFLIAKVIHALICYFVHYVQYQSAISCGWWVCQVSGWNDRLSPWIAKGYVQVTMATEIAGIHIHKY